MYKVSNIALATVASILTFSGIAFAEENSQPAGTPPVRPNAVLIKEKRADLKDAAKDVRNNFKTGVKDVRLETKEKMREATSSAERREIEKNAIDKRKGLIDARKASTTEIRDQRKELARQHIGKIEQRYAVAIKQFENLAVRIQSRIDKMKARGIDTSSAESALGLALTAIAQVKADAQALANVRTQVNSGDDAKALRTQIETAVKKLNASVKSAHKALETAGKALISIAKNQKTEADATTTAN